MTLERRRIEMLHEGAPASARIDRVKTMVTNVSGERSFQIEASDLATEVAASIAPDLGTCEACLDEVLDHASRRYGYAFTSCAACGPRLTIVTAAPYDRARTTMAAFRLCRACRDEYDEPTDRRFHAQPIACPACGPRLEAVGTDDDPIESAAATLRAGGIVAIKGLGGYHLACDASREDAVVTLRRRKQRDAKPFAVMVADADAAALLAHVSPAERELLESAARPLVLLARRHDRRRIAASVAPGVGDVGLMLPYTPLHHLLLRKMSGRPIVLTSGNVTDEPIAYRDDDARARLGTIADRFLTHDRPIQMPCEDSVARVAHGQPMILRRARGYAPAPVQLPIRLDRPTLALGGHLKAAFALGAGDVAFVSPHVGDLDEPSAYSAFADAIDHFQALHRLVPERVVCDRHPEYATSRLALALAKARGIGCVAIQHHHAHFASALADAGLAGPAVGAIFDGGGFGGDGTVWGGEILVGTYAASRRFAHLAQVPQPGGDRAAAEPWRMAISYLRAARQPIDAIEAAIGPRARRVLALCSYPDLAQLTSSAGRLFDAVAAITGIALHSAFEGQAAMKLETAARGVAEKGTYPIEYAGEALLVAPIIERIAADVARGMPTAVIARMFHSTIVELVARACVRAAGAYGIRDVVLSGGVFQNAILANEMPVRLATFGLRAHLHRRVPPNDGGLCLGQLVAAGTGGV